MSTVLLLALGAVGGVIVFVVLGAWLVVSAWRRGWGGWSG